MAYRKVISLLLMLVLIVAGVSTANQAEAHFVYVYGEDGKAVVVFGEGLDPDEAKFLEGLKAITASTVVGGNPQPVTLEKKTDGDQGWFETPLADLGSTVNVSCPYGVFQRGDVSLLLDYSAKFVRLAGEDLKVSPNKVSPKLALDIVPAWNNGQLKLTVYFKGMPLHEAEVSLISAQSASAEAAEAVTDEVGSVVLTPAMRYVVRAKHTVAEAGEWDGETFSEKRYYCTLVLDVGGESVDEDSDSNSVADLDAQSDVSPSRRVVIEKMETSFAQFPRGMTSFGAAVVGNQVFVAGGKSGKAHRYARSYQNREIFSLNFDKQDPWQVAGETLGLQGLAMVAYGNEMIRIGGLEVRNEEGEEQALRSIADVKSFDPQTQKWKTLPSLPQGRSSIDACLHDNKIYVVGGWTMAIGEDSQWASDMLVLDLAQDDPQWNSIPVPFQTRALAVRASGNRLYAIGGIDQSDGPTDRVHVFDVENESWSDGPPVPCEGGMKAFGCSAVVVAGTLLVSTYDGGIYGLDGQPKTDLSASTLTWEKLYQLQTGRFFHQMVPVGDSQFAIVGGSHMEHGSRNEVEVFSVVKPVE